MFMSGKVADVFPVMVAANKAVRSQIANKMVTRSVFAEILFNLSPTKNVNKILELTSFVI